MIGDIGHERHIQIARCIRPNTCSIRKIRIAGARNSSLRGAESYLRPGSDSVYTPGTERASRAIVNGKRAAAQAGCTRRKVDVDHAIRGHRVSLRCAGTATGIGKVHVLVAHGQEGDATDRRASGSGEVHRQRIAGFAHWLRTEVHALGLHFDHTVVAGIRDEYIFQRVHCHAAGARQSTAHSGLMADRSLSHLVNSIASGI